MTIITTSERFILRPICPGDWPVFRDYALSERARHSMGADTEGAAWRNFAILVGHQEIRGFAPFAIVPRGGEDRVIGVAGPFFPPDWPEPELGWQIWDGEYEGKGVAYEAAVAARAWLADAYGWTRMVSYIREANVRSIALAKRLGCTLDATAERRADGSPVWRHPAEEA